jgi:hypothetical protein
MMPPEVRETILRALSSAGCSDDLNRARSAWRRCTPEQMAQQYGESGQTRQQILGGYLAAQARFDAARAWVEAQS